MFTEFDEKVVGSVVLPKTGEETGVLYCKDVVYCSYGETLLHLQILVPTSGNRSVRPPMPPEMRARLGVPEFRPDWSYPCLVYVPGSAWAKQNCYGDVANFSEFVKMGYVVAIVEYREANGPFFSVEELLLVPGVKEATVRALLGEETVPEG